MLNDKLERNKVELLFNEWKYLSTKCESLKYIIQNGTDIIGKNDLKRWIESINSFDKDFKDLTRATHKLVVDALNKKTIEEANKIMSINL